MKKFYISLLAIVLGTFLEANAAGERENVPPMEGEQVLSGLSQKRKEELDHIMEKALGGKYSCYFLTFAGGRAVRTVNKEEARYLWDRLMDIPEEKRCDEEWQRARIFLSHTFTHWLWPWDSFQTFLNSNGLKDWEKESLVQRIEGRIDSMIKEGNKKDIDPLYDLFHFFNRLPKKSPTRQKGLSRKKSPTEKNPAINFSQPFCEIIAKYLSEWNEPINQSFQKLKDQFEKSTLVKAFKERFPNFQEEVKQSRPINFQEINRWIEEKEENFGREMEQWNRFMQEERSRLGDLPVDQFIENKGLISWEQNRKDEIKRGCWREIILEEIICQLLSFDENKEAPLFLLSKEEQDDLMKNLRVLNGGKPFGDLLTWYFVEITPDKVKHLANKGENFWSLCARMEKRGDIFEDTVPDIVSSMTRNENNVWELTADSSDLLSTLFVGYDSEYPEKNMKTIFNDLTKYKKIPLSELLVFLFNNKIRLDKKEERISEFNECVAHLMQRKFSSEDLGKFVDKIKALALEKRGEKTQEETQEEVNFQINEARKMVFSALEKILSFHGAVQPIGKAGAVVGEKYKTMPLGD